MLTIVGVTDFDLASDVINGRLVDTSTLYNRKPMIWRRHEGSTHHTLDTEDLEKILVLCMYGIENEPLTKSDEGRSVR